jgi:lysophospholipase L1-like esterase
MHRRQANDVLHNAGAAAQEIKRGLAASISRLAPVVPGRTLSRVIGVLGGLLAAGATWSAALSPDIAMWGDSMTHICHRHLGEAYAGRRQIYNGGVSGETSQQIRARMVADTAHKNRITVVWYGQNNKVKADVAADVAASLAALAPGNNRFIVLSMVGWARESVRNWPMHTQIVQANKELAARYPDNFIDIRAHLVGLYQRGSEQDQQDFRNDLVPSSLRSDDIHLKDEGCHAVAARVKEFIAAKGW